MSRTALTAIGWVEAQVVEFGPGFFDQRIQLTGIESLAGEDGPDRAVCSLAASISADQLRAWKAENPGAGSAVPYRMSGEEWHGSRIEPYWVENLCIAPPWERLGSEALNGYREVLLDPGVVFGTGTHPTTRDSLEALQLAFEDQTIIASPAQASRTPTTVVTVHDGAGQRRFGNYSHPATHVGFRTGQRAVHERHAERVVALSEAIGLA